MDSKDYAYVTFFRLGVHCNSTHINPKAGNTGPQDYKLRVILLQEKNGHGPEDTGQDRELLKHASHFFPDWFLYGLHYVILMELH